MSLDFIRHQQEREAAAYADAWLAQRNITWGDHFARPLPELQVMVFGRCVTFEEFAATEGERAAAAWRDEGPYQRGRRFARSYSVLAPDGEPGSVHVCSMVPLTAEQFETARRLGWDLSGVGPDDPDGMNLVRAVWTNPQWEGDRS